MYTLVLSGPASERSRVRDVLNRLAVVFEDGEHPHGWTPDPDESFMTVHYHDVNAVKVLIEGLGWSLRQHWADTGSWQRLGTGVDMGDLDTMNEIRKLKAQLVAAGITLPEG